MAERDATRLLDVVSAPLGDVIAEIGRGVAAAQEAMDTESLNHLNRIYTSDDAAVAALRDLGYRPTWYHMPSAEAELTVALTIGGQASSSSKRAGKGKMQLFAAPVDASYQNSYEYSITASSKLTFKIVPIPEPASLEARAVMPNVTGLTLAEAGTLLGRLGIAFKVTPQDAPGDHIVTSATEAGLLLEPGAIVELTVAPPGT